ncbi:CYTH domain-containing protein [Bacillus sp. FJAT-49732]|uniref:CYTH domain-containing protein n=1 Tax=Lederbergia citrisecunda TaxID=2833583 RepID=A0A942TKA4_9BACI|nr:CYTH domain-containing protein [Lederbergia citrisecunda]MBS4198688.1 CYTH domain-containing protein [Lederbergia citrisecunda]
MSRNIEIEFKNIVTEEEFQLLLRTFHISKKQFFSQKNHYFDTKDFALKKLGSALRIREKQEQYELTLKKPADIGLLEINDVINQTEANMLMNHSVFPSGEVKDELHKMKFPIDEFFLYGTLQTDRAETEYKNGLLVFDHSFYLGKEDFELEYETIDRDKGEQFFNELLEKLNIKIRYADNKISRLFKVIQGKKES